MSSTLTTYLTNEPNINAGNCGALLPSFGDPEHAEAHDRRILIVDDEAPVRNLFATVLSETYSVETACDTQQALDILAREPFALVLSDIHMPGLGGIELLRKIIEQYPQTAVIMISGVARTQRAVDAIRVGASDYLVKPCDLDALRFSIDRALARRLLIRSAGRYKRELETRNAELARQKAELESLQSRIVQTEKMASLGLLAAGVAHEINNPAGFIYSNIDVLRSHVDRLKECLAAYDKLPLPANLAMQIADIKKRISYDDLVGDLAAILSDCHIGAERIRDVVQNLRLFSRLDEAEVKRVDIHEGIEACLRLLAGFYKEGRITLARDYGDLPPVNCYAAQLNQVWMNLLVNAAQAIGNSVGEVRIRTRSGDKTITVAISDTGAGIPPENLAKIFDPFFTTKPVGEGTGLGLSISHSVIKQHNGTITVDTQPGQGTTFTITLPIELEQNRKS